MRGRPFLLLAGALFLSTFAILPYLRGDGNGYYAWLRSPVIQGDLQFEDEFARGDPAFLRSVFDDEGDLLPGMVTETGYVRNQWSTGPAVLWLPFFLLGHAVASMVGVATDGFSGPYLWFVGWGTAVFAAAGLWVSASVARRHYATGPVLLGTVGVWLASSLPIYQYLLPFWPFGGAILVSALIVRTWVTPGWGWRRWAGLGLLVGVMYMLHPVGIAWVALPLVSLLGLDPGTVGERIRAGAIFAGGVVVGAVPQFVGKAIVHGSPLDSGYQAEWEFLRPDVVRVLFGAEHGLFSWTPLLALAVGGLIVLTRRTDRRLGIGLLSVFIVMLYVVSAYATPEQSSFGNRFFVLFTPGFVLGAVALADLAWSRRVLAIGVVTTLIVWNALFMFQWAWGLIPKRGAVDWGIVVRQQVTDAPSEMARAVNLFFTDRAELIRIVQEQDLEQLDSGEDVSGER